MKKRFEISRKYTGVLCLALAVLVCLTMGTALAKYITTIEVGTFNLQIDGNRVFTILDNGELTVYNRNISIKDGVVTVEGVEKTYSPEEVYRFTGTLVSGVKLTEGAQDINTPLDETGKILTKSKVTKVTFADPIAISSAYGLFDGFSNCVSIDGLEKLNTEHCTNMQAMFSGCSNLLSLDLSTFSTSAVTNMTSMFESCKNLATLTWNPESFDTSSVTKMGRMFFDCGKLKAVDLSKFDTSNAETMDRMFYNCGSLTELDVTSFNTSKITNMVHMFEGCRSLTSLNVSGFDTQKVTSMRNMFNGCSGLTSLDLSNFNTTKVTTMENMFSGCSRLESLNINKEIFTTGQLKDASAMFKNCSKLASVPVSHFNTSNVEEMDSMFYGCSKLETLDVSGFDTAKVKKIDRMFYSCSSLIKLDVTKFNTAEAIDMTYMFGNCSGLTSLNVSSFDTGKVTLMISMFENCSGLEELNVAHFKTQNVTNMANMFKNCTGLVRLDVSGFNTQKVQNMIGMFTGCENLTSLDVSNFNTQNVTDMFAMFYGLNGLTSLNLSAFNTQNVTYMANMFTGCTTLHTIYVSDKFVINEEVFGSHTTNNGAVVDHDVDMFQNCLALCGGAGTTFSWDNANDATYAHIDGGTENPGYFTSADGTYDLLDKEISPIAIDINGIDETGLSWLPISSHENQQPYPNEDYVISFAAKEGFTLPEIITVTIDGMAYAVYTDGLEHREGDDLPPMPTFDPASGLLTISAVLLTEETQTVRIEAAAVEAEPAEPVCICEIKCTDLNADCPVCSTDISTCLGTELPPTEQVVPNGESTETDEDVTDTGETTPPILPEETEEGESGEAAEGSTLNLQQENPTE